MNKAKFVAYLSVLLFSPVSCGPNETVDSSDYKEYFGDDEGEGESAKRLAKMLFKGGDKTRGTLKGTLADKTHRGKMVAREYLQMFNYSSVSIVEGLREFVKGFSLTGESHDIARIAEHFSKRYYECNSKQFSSEDTVHRLVCSLLLLNTDLHSGVLSRRMSETQFITNVKRSDPEVPETYLKALYKDIKKVPILINEQDKTKPEPPCKKKDSYVDYVDFTKPGSFAEVKLPKNAPVYIEGLLLRKNDMRKADKKVRKGQRQWKPYYTFLKGFVLYFQRPNQVTLDVVDKSDTIIIVHSVAKEALDYQKKKGVFRLITHTRAEYLLSAANSKDMNDWIDAINLAAAQYSRSPVDIIDSRGNIELQYPVAPASNAIDIQAQVAHDQIQRIAGEMKAVQILMTTEETEEIYNKFERLQLSLERFSLYFASLLKTQIVQMPLNSNSPERESREASPTQSISGWSSLSRYSPGH